MGTYQSKIAKRLQLLTAASLLAATAFTLVSCNSQSFDVPPAVQEFGQKVTYNTEVDVLFVVDTTSSMAPHQKALAAQVGGLIDAFNQTGLDYQIAVTTMDVSSGGEKGKFIGTSTTPRILKKDTKDLAKVLAERLDIGTYDWNPMTRALEAVQLGLTGTNSSSGPNAGFLRPNALLTVIFLSDADDRSDASVNYKKWLDTIRPPLAYGDRSWVAQFIGVLPDDPNCSSKPQYNEPGYTYVDLAKYSGGAAESICDGDMRRALTNVKARVLEMVTEYPLGAKPVAATIKVVVDGQTVLQNETNGWTYIEARNVVRFHGTAIPKVGSKILVDFDRDGLN